MTVLLARHGQTDDNLEPKRFQGWRDTPLNDTGRAQAVALGERLVAEGTEIGSLWSSDLSRAAETAEIVGAHVGLRPQLDKRLREGYRGRWEGHLFTEVQSAEPELFAAWRRAGSSWRFPGGESLAEHQERVRAVVAEIRAAGPLPALAVCHGGSIRVMLSLSEPLGLGAFHSFRVPNTAVVPV